MQIHELTKLTEAGVMDYLKAAYSSAFNKGDPYQGTLGLYSKLYYMKDAT